MIKEKYLMIEIIRVKEEHSDFDKVELIVIEMSNKRKGRVID